MSEPDRTIDGGNKVEPTLRPGDFGQWEEGIGYASCDRLDAEAFAEGLVRLHEMPDLWLSVQSAGLARIQADCAPDAYRVRIRRICEAATFSRPIPPHRASVASSPAPCAGSSSAGCRSCSTPPIACAATPTWRPPPLDPFLHYVLIGGRRGYDPNGDFDTAFYRQQAKARHNPLRHYIKVGTAKGLDPHPHFSTFGYLGRYPDVAAGGANPLLHDREHGRPERRIADPSTRLPRTMVALAGVPSAHHWTLPGRGREGFSLILLRAPPDVSDAEPIPRIRVSLGLDFDLVDGVIDALTHFPMGVQDTVVLTLNADPARGGSVPRLMLALDHCHLHAAASDGTRTVRYAQAVLWHVRPTTPRVLVNLPHGTLRV